MTNKRPATVHKQEYKKGEYVFVIRFTHNEPLSLYMRVCVRFKKKR